MKTRVYIAGPMSKGDTVDNLSAALKAMRELVRLGYAPLCPQLSFFAEPFMREFTHGDWLGIDLPWVAVADVVLRLPGESVGADMEVAKARQASIPIVSSIEELTTRFSTEE